MTREEANIRIKDRPNKVRAKLIIDVEGEFYDDESTAETLRYCIEQDLEDAGFNVIDSEVFDLANKTSEQTGWIPVSERLPEYNKEVLTCRDDGFIEIQSIEGTYGYWENQKGDWSDFDEVTAWMPLPEPYKAESEE